MLEKKLSKRDFLRGARDVGLGLTAVFAPKLTQAAINPDKFIGYDTIGHRFLDVESDFGVTNQDYRILDSLIDQAKSRIDVKPSYSREDAINALHTIERILVDSGYYIVEENLLLNQGLKNKTIDCDNAVSIYLSIGEALGLPLKAVLAPGHVFVRWEFKDSHINWETRSHFGQVDDEFYIKGFSISKEPIDNRVYMESLSPDKSLAIAYFNVGTATYDKEFEKLKDPTKPDTDIEQFKRAIGYFDTALALNPTFVEAYVNRGNSKYFMGNNTQAIADYTKATTLDPTNLTIRDYRDSLMRHIASSLK